MISLNFLSKDVAFERKFKEIMDCKYPKLITNI
jgi:hypothetical protein